MLNSIVIAIDGPAGAGKSTVAKKLAKDLGFSYIDTGAMYRALTLKGIRQEIDFEDEQALTDLASNTNIDLESQGDVVKVFLDSEDVSEAIRTPDVTNKTFYAARTPGVRNIMVEWQRKIGSSRNIVMEGRDITTVVFPKATYKFYIDSNVEERARRRINELRDKGMDVDEQKIFQDIQERDHKDMTRKVGALKKAEDAIVIDASLMTVDDTVEELLKYIEI